MDPEDSTSPPATSPPSPQTPRKLPSDLPTSLDDRRSFPSYGEETEMYDGWQGKYFPTPRVDGLVLPPSPILTWSLSLGSSQYITAPTPARPLAFDLHLDTPAYDDAETFARIQDSDSRLMEMVAGIYTGKDSW